MTDPLLHLRSAVDVRVYLPLVCPSEVREHCGYETSPAGPHLFSAKCEYFTEEQTEAQWADRSPLESFTELEEHERRHDSSQTNHQFRIAEAARHKAVNLFGLWGGSLGVPVGWELRRRNQGNNDDAIVWSHERLQREGTTLSHFLRSAARPDDTFLELDLHIPVALVRTKRYGSILPWILAEDRAKEQRRTSKQHKRKKKSKAGSDDDDDDDDDDDEYRQPNRGLGAFRQAKRKQTVRVTEEAPASRTCAVDVSSDITEQAHLVPRYLSEHTFKTIIAAIRLCLDEAQVHGSVAGGLRNILNQVTVLTSGLQPSASGDELSRSLVDLNLKSDMVNNMIALQPQLHNLLDTLRLYICPLSASPVWISPTRMPFAMSVALTGAYGGCPLRAYLQSLQRTILPAAYANACYTLFSATATPDLKERLRKRAALIISLRQVRTPRQSPRVKRGRPSDESEGGGGGGGGSGGGGSGGGGGGKFKRAKRQQSPRGPMQPPREGGSPSERQQPGESSGARLRANTGQRRTPERSESLQDAGAALWTSPTGSRRFDASSSSGWAGATSTVRSLDTPPTSVHSAADAFPPAKGNPGVSLTHPPREALPRHAATTPQTETRAEAPQRSDSPPGELAGDPFDAWWIKNGGDPGERPLRQAVVDLNAIAGFIPDLDDYRRYPSLFFDLICDDVRDSFLTSDRDSAESDSDGESLYEKLTPRILEILGIDDEGQDTDGGILNTDAYEDLTREYWQASFYLWWPVHLAGETAALDQTGRMGSDSQG